VERGAESPEEADYLERRQKVPSLPSLLVFQVNTCFCCQHFRAKPKRNPISGAVFRIQDIWCGSGFGSADPSLWLMDPDPAIFKIDLEDANKNYRNFLLSFPAYYFLKVHLHHF
jgi:hypothetical protein